MCHRLTYILSCPRVSDIRNAIGVGASQYAGCVPHGGELEG
jgi:hypothetical protein